VGSYANNHIATRSYLQGWSDGNSGQLARVPVADPLGSSELKKPRKVGRRRRFFGDDPLVCKEAEERFNVFEDKGVFALKQLGESWPPDQEARIDIGCFVGVHMVRNPSFLEMTAALSEAQFSRKKDSYEQTMSAEQIDEMLAYFRSSRFQVEYLLDLVPKQASLLASTHWTLLEFPEPLLATSDQPVSVVPFLDDGTTVDVAAAPQTGFLDSEEIRFPISPHRALLLTWIEGFDKEAVVLAEDRVATELNRAVIAQADREWFHHPGRRATRLNPMDFGDRLCRPVAQLLDPQYGTPYARNSPRRRHRDHDRERGFRSGGMGAGRARARGRK
jgi:Protein of unknown function (DUF4238)